MCLSSMVSLQPAVLNMGGSKLTKYVLGFPRNLEQFRYFEEIIGPIEFVIMLQCSEHVLIERLLPRGRFDDSLETIQGRLRTFKEVTSLIVDEFRQRGKLKILNGEETVAEVNRQLILIFSALVDAR